MKGQNLLLVYVAVLAVLLLLTLLFAMFMRTRRFSMVLAMIMGLLIGIGGIYLVFLPEWRSIAYVLLITGGVLILIAAILFIAFKKRPPRPGKGPKPEGPAGSGPEGPNPPGPEK